MINDLEKWKEEYDTIEPTNDYAKAIWRVADILMGLLDKLPENKPVDANALVHEADHISKEEITGNMASYVALLVSKYHSRGLEFKHSWNKHWGGETDHDGVVNPSILEV